MNADVVKALLGKEYGKCSRNLDPGVYEVDETVTLHVAGTCTKLDDEWVRPTHRIPYLTVIALVLEKSGVTRDAATRLVREALNETIEGIPEERVDALADRVKDIDNAVSVVRNQVLNQLPKVPKSGKFLSDVEINILEPLEESEAMTPEEEQAYLRNAVMAKLSSLPE